MTEFLSKFRFLPIMIFSASMMLTVKIGDIWEGIDGLRSGAISIAGAEAQQRTGGEDATKPKTATETAEPSAVDAEDPDSAADDAAARSLTTDDPTLLTQQEMDLLQQLAERRETLEARSTELDMRTGMLDAAEARIEEKIRELKRFQATIERLIKTYDNQQESNLDSLVKVYENMKPKDAALIFEQLDMDTLLLVVEKMKERKLAAVLSKMNREKASEVTVELMHLRQLPKPGSTGG